LHEDFISGRRAGCNPVVVENGVASKLSKFSVTWGMASIEILNWKQGFDGFTAWDSRGRSELKKRLRIGVNAPAAEIRGLFHELLEHHAITLDNIRDEYLNSVTQILQTMGAEVKITFAKNKTPQQLFKKLPKRGRSMEKKPKA
jgi:hypothetical protein